ncbi:hypothetical protein [Pseudomonas fluorescens]|uniref:hypothetical protein n=1 Tax=Pseudomonas fluorescens TaxID=294 RepID=UPI003D094CDB
MRRKSIGLEWLTRGNLKQQQWAHNYLQKKDLIDQAHSSSTDDDLRLIGRELEKSKDGQAIIGLMKNAWRQVKSNAPEKGWKVGRFKLKAEVKKELVALAKKNNTTETDMLRILISDGASAHARLRAKLDDLQEKTRNLSQSKNAVTDLFEFVVAMLCRTEILLHDTLSTVTITQDQENRIEKLRKEVLTEANADIVASVGEIDKIRLRIPGRLYKAMKEEKRASRLITSKTTQANLTNLEPVTYSKPSSKKAPEAQAKINSKGTTSALPNHPVSKTVEMEPGKLVTDAPHPSPQITTQNPPGIGARPRTLGDLLREQEEASDSKT